MKKEDVPQVHKLLNAYLKNYSMAPIFDEHEIAHWLTPQRNIVNCYVVEVWGGSFMTLISVVE